MSMQYVYLIRSELIIKVENFNSLSVLLGGGHSGGNETVFSVNSVGDPIFEVSGG